MKSGFVGSNWKRWFHNGDPAQNLQLPENFSSCNYKNKSKTNLPLSGSPIPRRFGTQGQFLRSLLPLRPDWPNTELSEPSWVPSPMKQPPRVTLPCLATSIWAYRHRDSLLYFAKTPPFFLSFLVAVQPLSSPWEKQDTESAWDSRFGKVIMKMRFGDKFWGSSTISLPLSYS